MKKKVVIGVVAVCVVACILFVGILIGSGGLGESSVKELSYEEIEAVVRGYSKYYKITEMSNVGVPMGSPQKVIRISTESWSGNDGGGVIDYCVFASKEKAQEAMSEKYEQYKSDSNSNLTGSKSSFSVSYKSGDGFVCAVRKGNTVLYGEARKYIGGSGRISQIAEDLGYKIK
ncbi:MAG: hypothetical protein IJ716_15845 [Lachnospiraceae bacterium]|nr:hypothetical protein [Lachnospiraceae bacterium]MBR1852563.1 hypothetical protein [Lachnospiraceae bacterium]